MYLFFKMYFLVCVREREKVRVMKREKERERKSMLMNKCFYISYKCNNIWVGKNLKLFL